MSNTIGNHATTPQTILVLGATGKTGSRIFKTLTELGWPVRSGSRSADPKFDWMDDSTWDAALQGIHSVYISFQPDIAVPGATDIIRHFTQRAKAAGVQRLVLLSGRGESEAQEAEQIVINSGLEWTILRASWFCQNFSEGFLLDSVLAGHVAMPAGNVREPFVDIDDIAEVAVAALTATGPNGQAHNGPVNSAPTYGGQSHNRQIYELTGPRLLTFGTAVAEIAAASGRTIQYQQMSVTDYAAMLTEFQVPKEYIQLLTYLFSEVLDGRNEKTADGVERALGRKATDFSEYVRKTASTGVWDRQ